MDQAQATGFGVAAVGHAALLTALWFLARGAGETVPPAPAIEVSFAEDVGLVTSAPVPASEPQAAAAAADPALPEDVRPTDRPEPPLPEPRPGARPQPRQEQQPLRPQPQPAERRRSPGLDDLDPRSFGRDPAAKSNNPPAAVPGPARASIDAAIVRALLPCQRQPLPSPEAARIRVRMRVTLNRDGSLARAEVIRVENDDPSLEIYERRMQDLARNVITQCTPIRGLPPEYYDVPRGWRQFPFTFDPRSR